MKRHDLVIIGGGTGGLVSALIAAAVGARVALIERGRTGGDCLWTGCVPSKTLIATAAAAQVMRTADRLGLTPVEPSVDFAAVMRRVRNAIAAIQPQDSVERLRDAGVEVISADARFTGPHRIRAGDRELRWRAAIIATGSEPVIPSLEGLSDADPLTTDTVWHLDQLPARLLLMGGGPVGCELAQALARLGAQVTIVETASRLLLKEEPRASDFIREQLEKEGINVRLGAQPRRVTGEDDRFRLEFDETDQPVIFDR
ncbi:MAG: FAD-dependent oxidoreductase, partial [Trebonia sp.]